jgi:hypothetical protein
LATTKDGRRAAEDWVYPKRGLGAAVVVRQWSSGRVMRGRIEQSKPRTGWGGVGGARLLEGGCSGGQSTRGRAPEAGMASICKVRYMAAYTTAESMWSRWIMLSARLAEALVRSRGGRGASNGGTRRNGDRGAGARQRGDACSDVGWPSSSLACSSLAHTGPTDWQGPSLSWQGNKSAPLIRPARE